MREVREGVWELAVTLNPAQDLNRRAYRTVRGDREDAAAALAAFVAATGGTARDLNALVRAHLDALSAEGRSSATLRRYDQLWRQWLAPTLGPLSPRRVGTDDIEGALAAMADAGQSHSSIHQAAVVLNGGLARAHRGGHLTHNPARGIRLPNGTHLAATRQR